VWTRIIVTALAIVTWNRIVPLFFIFVTVVFIEEILNVKNIEFFFSNSFSTVSSYLHSLVRDNGYSKCPPRDKVDIPRKCVSWFVVVMKKMKEREVDKLGEIENFILIPNIANLMQNCTWKKYILNFHMFLFIFMIEKENTWLSISLA
jgi:hypothetical protein